MKTRALFLVLVLGSWPTAPLRGTTLVRLSLDQLTEAASEVVRGRVVGQESRWNSTQTQIVTLTTIAVDRVMKGRPPATLIIEQPGGTVGNLHARVAGTVHFHPNVDYLLFLEPASSDPSRYLVVGMAQGAYRIFRDTQTQEERAIRPFGSLFYRPSEKSGGAESQAQTISLHAFQQQISAALQAPLVIPRETSIAVTIQATEPRGVERVRVFGRTTTAVYPNANLVIPAGSTVAGTAQLIAGKWSIRWTEVFIRGAQVRISASNEELASGSLRGRPLVIKVR